MQTLLLKPLKIIIVLRPELSSSLWAQTKTERVKFQELRMLKPAPSFSLKPGW